MPDNHKFIAARIRLNALCDNPPSFPSEKDVADYHSILKEIESNSPYDLSAFTIPDDQLARKVTSSVPRSYSGRPGRIFYSSDKRVDRDFFTRQVIGARDFLNEVTKQLQPAATNSPDYWSMTDNELIALAAGYGIGYVYRSHKAGPGRSPAPDRDKLIAQLLERDRALRSGRPSHVTVNIQGDVTGSTIQAASPDATASVTSRIDPAALAHIISNLKAEKPNLVLSNYESARFDLDIHTLEKQVDLPAANRSIVIQCLDDVSKLFLNVGAGVASNAIYAALLKFLGSLH